MSLRKLEQAEIDIMSSIVCGSIQAGIFNPVDRALYLSVIEHRPFLHRLNFTSPFHGFTQSVFHRIISGGFYFFLQATFRDIVTPIMIKHNRSENEIHFVVGMLAGGINGAFLNQLATVKYHCWGKEGLRFSFAVREMWGHGGFKPFFKGISDTIYRDAVNGIFYELLRNYFKHKLVQSDSEKSTIFFCNMSAAAIATAISAPLNYARNIKFSTHPKDKPLTTFECIKELIVETKKQTPTFQKVSYLQQRLRIGWGTARVGVGMAIGQEVFDRTRTILHNIFG